MLGGGLEHSCPLPRKGCSWPRPRTFFVSLASSLVSSTTPLVNVEINSVYKPSEILVDDQKAWIWPAFDFSLFIYFFPLSKKNVLWCLFFRMSMNEEKYWKLTLHETYSNILCFHCFTFRNLICLLLRKIRKLWRKLRQHLSKSTELWRAWRTLQITSTLMTKLMRLLRMPSFHIFSGFRWMIFMFRSKTTGSMLGWWLTGYFCGFLWWSESSGQLVSSCNRCWIPSTAKAEPIFIDNFVSHKVVVWRHTVRAMLWHTGPEYKQLSEGGNKSLPK